MNKSQKVSSSQIDRDRELDKISQLPEHLIDKILSLLSIRDAVRTSILSSNWRFKWTTISNLVFDDNVVTDKSSSVSKLVNIIYTVLLFHSGGPVEKFVFSHKQYKVATSDVDLWIRYLSKASTITLDFCERERSTNQAPSSLFYCEGLTSLRLCNCSVNLPVSPTFRGFKNLKILYLQRVNNVKIVWNNIASGSDVLEDLSLINYRFSPSFNIVAPKLKHLCLRGSLTDFGFGDRFNSTFCSPSFHMEFYEDNTGWSDELKNSINLLKFVAPLQSVETLKLDGDILKYLSVEEVPAMLAEPLLLLKKLFISGINFRSGKQLLVILCLLRSAPNLKQLKISGAEKGEHNAEVDDEIYDSPCTFAQLNYVWLTGIGDSVFEMGFIGILLSSSPALQKMTIKAARYSKLCPSGRGDHKLVKNMMRLQYPSVQAKLSFL